MYMYVQKNRNPFVDFPWISAMFKQPQPIALIQAVPDCLPTYTNPDDAATCAVGGGSSGGIVPAGTPTAAPTSTEANCRVGHLAVIAFNSGSYA